METAGKHARDFGLRFGYALLAVLSLLALVLTGFAYYGLGSLNDNMGSTDALSDVPGTPDEDGAVDVLLVGTDSRTDAKGNPLPEDVLRDLRTEFNAGVSTDTLIIMRFPAGGGPPRAVSLPRDSWIDVPAGGQNKINSVFNTAKEAERQRLRNEGETDRTELEVQSDNAGRAALVQAVQDFTQVRIDHYAEVSLLGFYLLTEALGGVEVCLNQATRDPDSGADFQAGTQVVSGGEALAFVRQRKNLPRGDLDRIQRQQAFLASALHQVLSAGTLTSPGRLSELAEAIEQSVVLDKDLDVLSFAEKVRNMASGDMEFVTIPVVTIDGRSDGGQSIVEVDAEEVREFIAALIDPDAEQATGGGSSPLGGSSAGQDDEDDPITGGQAPCVN